MRGLYKHQKRGKIVLIDNGEYHIDGRLSNHYTGRVLDKDGFITDETLGDYGMYWEKINNYKIKIILDNEM